MDSLSSLAVGEPRFPPELEHKIFEIAALARVTEIPILLRVAQRVKQWVEPLLYRVVFCRASEHARPIHGFPAFTTDILLEGNRAALVANSVKHVFLADRTRTDAILIACPRVTSLFMCLDSYKELDALLELESLQRLTINYDAAFVSTPIDLLRNITHLHLYEVFTHPNLDLDHLCARLSLMPSLTHVILEALPFTPQFYTALHENMRLQCIVFLYDSIHTIMDARPLVDDHRFVCILQEAQSQLHVDWLRDVLGTGKDYWARAVAFIADRLAGRIKASYYGVSHPDPETFF
ncbi:hypothetical protein B0H13DRAFT_2661374 [Mycena leptocephala]|nr:hypothetical protein B0H13DRAFT_2661374 [Mycena leptocephala]